MELVVLANALKTPVIRFGDHIPAAAKLATVIGAGADEFAEKIAELSVVGLVCAEPDQAIKILLLEREMDRTEVNRANGLRGGRPRKDGSPAQRRN
jgi:hypothetical protein